MLKLTLLLFASAIILFSCSSEIKETKDDAEIVLW